MSFVFYYLPIIVAFVALAYAFMRATWVTKQDPGNDRMKLIGKWIADGAMAFLAREYKSLAIFVVVKFVNGMRAAQHERALRQREPGRDDRLRHGVGKRLSGRTLGSAAPGQHGTQTGLREPCTKCCPVGGRPELLGTRGRVQEHDVGMRCAPVGRGPRANEVEHRRPFQPIVQCLRGQRTQAFDRVPVGIDTEAMPVGHRRQRLARARPVETRDRGARPTGHPRAFDEPLQVDDEVVSGGAQPVARRADLLPGPGLQQRAPPPAYRHRDHVGDRGMQARKIGEEIGRAHV